MPNYIYRCTLVDTKALKTTMVFHLSDTVYADAQLGALAIEAEIEGVSDANVYASSLTEVLSGDPSLPADADITDEALVVCYLSGTGEIPKFWNLRIPAPIDGLFNADGVTVDITNQSLQDLVATLSMEAKVSDNEVINLDIQEGIESGSWRSVKKSTK